jgi:NodT family efflux transporter outer membrane factor (OMF) lipoprotein
MMSADARRRLPGLIASVAIVLLMGACTTVGPDFDPPEAPVAPDWYQEEREGLTSTGTELVAWWEVFGDPKLNRLVEEAHRTNNNLEIAAVRILESRAQLGIATGLRYPQAQTVVGSAGYVSPSEAGGSAEEFWDFSLGASVSWEIDFWGRYRRGIESANAALLATMAGYDDVFVLLTAQVAQTYATIRLTEEQLRIAKQNIEIQRRSYEIVDVLARLGDKSALDRQQALTLLLGTEATLPNLEASLQQAKNALNALLGRPPGDLTEFLGEEGTLPDIPDDLVVGIPADLLRRRPDVRTAELNAMAQNALVGVATADLYPSFSLFGFLGLSAGGPGTDLGDLFNGDSLNWNVGGSFYWPFLNYGRIRNNIRVQDARLQQALIAYRETVIQAAREVEDAMVGYLGALEGVGILAQAVESARRSNDLSMLRYTEGFSDYQRVLDAQQSLFSQQSRYINNRGAAVLAVVDLYKSLGGGWEIHGGTYNVSPETQEEMEQRTNWGDSFVTEVEKEGGTSD